MSDRYVIEAWLRPAIGIEQCSASGGRFVCGSALAVALSPSVIMSPPVRLPVFPALRAHQGFGITLPPESPASTRYQVTSAQVPVSRQRVCFWERVSVAAKTRNACWKPSVRKWWWGSCRHITGWPGSLKSFSRIPFSGGLPAFAKRQLAEFSPPGHAGGESGVTRCGADEVNVTNGFT